MAAGVGTTVFEDDLAGDGFGNDQINDIFGDDDDLFNAPAPLPPLSPSGIDGGVSNLDGAGEGESDDKEKKKKKIIKRSPRPRLNEARLCGERGITALAHLCDGAKFKGKGHEASDLRALLQRFEHWAHRLYPMYPFEDVVEQVEALGKKKLVQNAVKQARRGDDGQVNENNPSDDENEMQVNGQDSELNLGSTPSIDNTTFGGHVEASSAPVLGLTPEQQERIRLNRERALAKRRAQSSQQADPSSQPASQDGTNAVNSQNSLEKGSQDQRDEAEHIPSQRSPERSKLNFDAETEGVEEGDLELDEETMVTDVTGDTETMETKIGQDKEAFETEVVGDEETMETEIIGDKETMETEVMQDKETMATEGRENKETMETEGTVSKETMETEGAQDKETIETEVTVNKETMETEVVQDKETMETEVTVNKETMETEGAQDKETMETEVTVNQETMETEGAQDKETM